MATEAAPRRRAVRRRRGRGSDHLTVMLYTLAAFLVVLALLAQQLRVPAHGASRPVPVVLRKIYRTTVIETIAAGGGAGAGVGTGASATSVTQSVSNPPPPAVTPAPITRTS